jgi:photosystem I subunit 10
MASQLSAAASMSAAAVPQFHGLRGYASPRSAVAMPSVRVGRKRSQGIRCGYIGCATNLVRMSSCPCVDIVGGRSE